MAGIKHHLWGQFPEGPKNTGNYKQDQLDWQHKLIAEHKAYCGVCGQQIMQANEDSDGRGVDWAMEMQMGMHYKCYTEEMHRRRAEMQRGNQS